MEMILPQDQAPDAGTISLATKLVILGIGSVFSTPPLLLLILWRVW
jgi:hypothetical protein